jgi:hypothetical protein
LVFVPHINSTSIDSSYHRTPEASTLKHQKWFWISRKYIFLQTNNN